MRLADGCWPPCRQRPSWVTVTRRSGFCPRPMLQLPKALKRTAAWLMVKSGSGFAKTWRSKSYSGPEHAELGAVRTQAAQLLKKLPLLTLIEFLLLRALAWGNKRRWCCCCYCCCCCCCCCCLLLMLFVIVVGALIRHVAQASCSRS